jgi:hypothetical protein
VSAGPFLRESAILTADRQGAKARKEWPAGPHLPNGRG